MATNYEKDPQATLDYSIDWSEWLETGETIASSQWFAEDGITMSTTGNTSTVATVWLTGGTLGQSYELVNRITTNNSPARVDERTIVIFIVNK